MVVAMLGLVSCNGSKRNQGHENHVVMCDGSISGVMDKELKVFDILNPDDKVSIQYTTPGVAIDSLLDQKTDIIIIPNKLSTKEEEYVKKTSGICVQQLLAVDALALITNMANPCEILAVDEVKEIFSGKVTKWRELSPSKLGNIKIVVDSMGVSLMEYMKDSIMGGAKLPTKVVLCKNGDAVRKMVSKDKNAIGVLSVSWVGADTIAAKQSIEEMAKNIDVNDVTSVEFFKDIKTVKIRRDDSIKAFQPYSAYIYSGEYPFTRRIYAISTANVGSVMNKFYTFLLQRGQKVLVKNGLVPGINYR